MYTFVITLHVILCVLLIFIILMQPGKGADVSSAFGGGSASQLFGASGPGNFLTRGTGIIAALFMLTSVTLVLYSTKGSGALNGLENVQQEEEGGGFGNSTKPSNTLPPLPNSDGIVPGGPGAGGAAPDAGGAVPAEGAGGATPAPVDGAGGAAPSATPTPAPTAPAPAAPATPTPAPTPAAPATPTPAPAAPAPAAPAAPAPNPGVPNP